MIFKTSSEGIRIFKTSILVNSILDITSIEEVITSNGFDVVKSYRYSIDNLTYSNEFTTIVDMLLAMNSDSILLLLTDFTLYLSIKHTIIKNSVYNDLSKYSFDQLLINSDVFVGTILMEIGSSLEQTIIRSSSNSTLNPYKVNDHTKDLYRELSIGINEMFGFDAIYFRTESDSNKADITFKTYELNNVVETKKLKLSIKDNEIPEALERFDEYGFDFQNELIIHIVKFEFERIFGIGKKPNSNDFIYLPLTDKMYQLNSPYDPKSFMNYAPFWEIMTTKYEKRSSVANQNDDDNFHKVDDMILFNADYFADKEKLELEDSVKDYNKPDQLSALSNEHIVSDEMLPMSSNMSFKYSISTMNALQNQVVKEYDFYQDYDKKLMITSWFKLSETTERIFDMTNEASNLFLYATKSNDNVIISYENLDNQEKTITLSTILNSFVGLVIFINYETYEIDALIVDENMNVISSGSDVITSNPVHFNTLRIFGQIKYNLLRVCKNVEKYTYEDLLVNDLLPNKQDFVVMKNATPTINIDL